MSELSETQDWLAETRAEAALALAEANKHREVLVLTLDIVRRECAEATANYDIEKRQHDQTKAAVVALREHASEWIATLRSLSESDARRFALGFDAAKRLSGLLDSPNPAGRAQGVEWAAVRAWKGEPDAG